MTYGRSASWSAGTGSASTVSRSATITLLVVSSFDRKSGTLSGWRSTAAFGRVLGAAWIHPLAHHHEDVVLAGRHRKSRG